MAVLDTLGGQLGTLIHNLIIGNTRKAKRHANLLNESLENTDSSILIQNFIEKNAQEQAIRCGFLNLPSIFPGIGTLISVGLVGAENFLILDQSVTLILTLLYARGVQDCEEFPVDEFVMQIIGEAFNLLDETMNTSTISQPHAIACRYMTKELPQKYANIGLNHILSRLFPYRKGFKFLPFVGVAVSIYDGYEIIVRVGQTAIKYIKDLNAENHHQNCF